jgi:hypothetical protein
MTRGNLHGPPGSKRSGGPSLYAAPRGDHRASAHRSRDRGARLAPRFERHEQGASLGDPRARRQLPLSGRPGRHMGDVPLTLATCSIEGCRRPRSRQGYCQAHAWRLAHHGDVRADIPLGAMHSPAPPALVAARTAAHRTPAYRSRAAETTRVLWQDRSRHSYRAMVTSAMRRPETRARLAAAARASWATPEYREKHTARAPPIRSQCGAPVWGHEMGPGPVSGGHCRTGNRTEVRS